jgi:hypothetical protein
MYVFENVKIFNLQTYEPVKKVKLTLLTSNLSFVD